ncbi:hypothetical protein I3842_05G157000 [Carya illinoinensis]|uniref:Replication factor A C-terminal domain-containing protein n=1 Tax=Carya illinoinensis TaxID=32201 RepID=A0A922F3J9_CARIL|nr:hypothetical protein I3842_05G157000 [Carya illinoinensis]KAG6713516.1 hypothetical protein I3842_05G157000 [Carya illinoinensis]
MIMVAQNDVLLEEIIGSSFGLASSSSTDPIIKISEIAERLIIAPAMTKSTLLVKGKFRMVDFHQSFHYMSCENCNKAIGYERGENFICYSCKNMTIAQPRCLVCLDVYDDSTLTPVAIFGSLAKQILGCITINLIEHRGKAVHEQSKRDQFLIKLRLEFEATRSNLINRDPVPSLDVCFGELLHEE